MEGVRFKFKGKNRNEKQMLLFGNTLSLIFWRHGSEICCACPMMSRKVRAEKDCCVFHSRVITLCRVMEMVRAGVWEAAGGENGMVFELGIVRKVGRGEVGMNGGKLLGLEPCTLEGI